VAERLDGTVVTFDEHRVLGEIEAADGRRYPFHCTQIADGTRTIEVGVAVRFVVTPGPVGRWEAGRVSRA
jgi:CspA family cold shock protein